MTNLKRIGNWYSVTMNDTEYNVLIQKDENKVTCEPSSIIVLDEEFKEVYSPSVLDDMISLFRKVDFKYDMVDED